MTDVEKRLADLERQMKTYRLTAAALGVSLVLGLAVVPRQAISQAPGNTVKAPFRVVDSKGKALLEVLTTDAGGGGLRVLNANQKTVAVLGATEAGGTIDVFNSKGIMVAGLGASQKGEGHIGTYNQDGVALVDIFRTPEGGAIDIAKKDGKTVLELHSGEDGAVMEMLNADDDLAVALTSEARGGRMTMFNKGGSRAVVLAAMGDLSTIAAIDRQSKARAVLGVNDSGGSVDIADSKGEVLLKKP